MNYSKGRAIAAAMAPFQDTALSIRDYRPSDKERCLALFDSNVGKYFAPYERARFESFLRDLSGPYIILERATDVIACGGYAPHKTDPTIAVFCWGMVHKAHHKAGYGRSLTEARLRSIHANERFTRIRLRTSQHTSGFYEKLGFEIIETKENGIADGIDECVMERARIVS